MTLTSTILSIFWYFGIFKMLELAYRVAWMVRRHLRTTNHLVERYGKGSWAMITGGSDGIGLEMAKELVRLGFNIVIIGRNPEKLKQAST